MIKKLNIDVKNSNELVKLIKYFNKNNIKHIFYKSYKDIYLYPCYICFEKNAFRFCYKYKHTILTVERFIKKDRKKKIKRILDD